MREHPSSASGMLGRGQGDAPGCHRRGPSRQPDIAARVIGMAKEPDQVLLLLARLHRVKEGRALRHSPADCCLLLESLGGSLQLVVQEAIQAPWKRAEGFGVEGVELVIDSLSHHQAKGPGVLRELILILILRWVFHMGVPITDRLVQHRELCKTHSQDSLGLPWQQVEKIEWYQPSPWRDLISGRLHR